MRKTLLVSLSLMLSLALVVSLASAKYVAKTDRVAELNAMAASVPIPLDELSRLPAASVASTTFLRSFTFDSLVINCIDEGFVSVDFSAQLGTFFHIASTADELDGGTLGRLNPPQGSAAVWCGANLNAPTAPPNALCGYADLPGYGNNWNQAWCTKDCIDVSNGSATVTALLTWDSEPGYDGTTIEVDSCTGLVPNNIWVAADSVHSGGGHFDGIGVDSLHTHSIPDSLHNGTIRIRFHFQADGAWSDSDGLWDTDGAIIIDSLSVSDAGGIVLAVDDFEDETPGQTSHTADDWYACDTGSYGDFGGLIFAPDSAGGLSLDPCVSQADLDCVWEFYDELDVKGDTGDYTCGGYPNVPVTPYYDPPASFQDNQVVSPPVQYAGVGTGATVRMRFDYYADLPNAQNVFCYWHVRNAVAGCFGGYLDNATVRFSDDPTWVRQAIRDLSPFVDPAASHIQVSAGVIDLCPFWCTPTAPGTCHSNAPLIDNVDVFRIATVGPVWTIQGFTLFQDSFADDGTLTGTSRIDIDIDRNQFTNPVYRAGDSLTARCADPENGLAIDLTAPWSSAAVYAYVALYPQGQVAKEGAGGTGLVNDPVVINPIVGSTVINGDTWYQIRMDTSFTNGAARTGAQPDAFALDLNDNLFTPGDTICYFLAAKSADVGATWSYWIEPEPTGTFGGFTTTDMNVAASYPVEVQILPSDSLVDILYVDAYDGRGVQTYFDTAFRMLGMESEVDRFDYRMTTSDQGNGPGNMVINALAQIVPVYTKIIWGNGRTVVHLMDDGTQKSDDAFVVHTFLNQTTKSGGLYYSGNSAGSELYDPAALANMVALQGFLGATINNNSAVLQGFGRTPFLIGTTGVGNIFGDPASHPLGPDTLIADGSCPAEELFDVMTPTGNAVTEMYYKRSDALPDPGPPNGAILSQRTVNAQGDTVGMVLSGVGFAWLRNAPDDFGPPARAHHLNDILTFLNNDSRNPTGVKPSGYVNSLSQNYPNPFNPQTTIEFSLKERAHVTLKVYNVAGQLVKTLVDGVRNAGVYDNLTWDGRNDKGQAVSSGVYFYKLVTKNFTQTKKMVLLK